MRLCKKLFNVSLIAVLLPMIFSGCEKSAENQLSSSAWWAKSFAVPFTPAWYILLLFVIGLLIYLLLKKRDEGKRLEDMVFRRTTEFEALARNYKGIIWCVDANRIVTTFKGRYANMLEPYSSQVEGATIGSARHNDMHIELNDHVEKTFLGEPQSWTNEINNRTYQSYTTPIYDNNGNVIGVGGSTDDITEMVALQHGLFIEKVALEAIFHMTPAMITCKDLDLKFTKCNKRFEEHTGLRVADVLGKDSYGPLMESGTIERIREADKKVISENSLITIEERMLIPSGDVRDFEIAKAPLTKDGVTYGVVSVVHDITERKTREETIRRRENMSAALNQMSVIFLARNDESFEGRMSAGVKIIVDLLKLDRMSVWRNTLTLDGLSASQIYRWDRKAGGTTPPKPEFQNVLYALLEPNWEKYLSGEMVGNGPVKQESSPPILANGEAVSAAFMPLVIKNAFWGFVLFEDMYNERYFEADTMEIMRTAAFLCANTFMRTESDMEIKAAMETAESANRAKSEFLSRMSHEMRTPLNAVMGMINIGLTTDDAGKKDYCLERANSASKHLLGVINDILDISKIEANKFELSYEDFDFEAMLINIANVVNVRAEEKKQTFVVNISKDVPHYINGDQLRLSQVITNLLSNAVKFTPERGTVSLNIEKINELNDAVTLKIEVVDTGIGIDEEQQKHLFSPFGQANADIARKFGGTGLGLTISKRIVDLMGGAIWIESTPGKGSKFIVTIPAKKARKKPRKTLSPKIRKEELRILAVDDSAEIREYFLHVMESLNLSCEVADGGHHAIEMVKRAVAKPYNIFFVDWQMPDMNGIELTKKIKEINGENSIVIMISVADWSEIEKEAHAVGVKHFIPKPLFQSTLIDAINICVGLDAKDDTDVSSEPAVKSRFDFSGHTLLIAEDIDINQEIMSAILEETHVAIDFAKNGKIAVSMFKENPDKYSLILMDIQMPEMHGYEATQKIRALNMEQAKKIPIIAMTANVFREDIEKCIAAGMNGHTGKPVDSEALFEILQKHLTGSAENEKIKNVYELEYGIAWSDDLLTGNALVDMQHQQIFEQVSDLVRSCEDGSGKEKLKETLDFLVIHTTRHFVDEEALQLEYGYPGYEEQRKMHDDFKATINGLVQRFTESGSSVELSDEVNRIVVKWLVEHIQREDKKLSEYIRSVKAGREQSQSQI